MMIPWLSFALANQPVDPGAMATGPTRFAHVVFARIPTQRQRRAVIRKAMHKSPALTGGRDWGRVTCFAYDGEAELDVLETILRRKKLDGAVRYAPDCANPPGDAFIPPDPIAYAAVTLAEPAGPDVARQALQFVLQGDHGVSGIHVAADTSSAVCLELERKVKPAMLFTLLGTSPLQVTEVRRADDCADALGASP
jgi:hypothetical protein